MCKVSFTYLKEDDFKPEQVQRRADGMIREAYCPRRDNDNIIQLVWSSRTKVGKRYDYYV